jgi:UDP:flavonoid glycosyltransferase YjiC (YdhE family)
MRVLVVTWGPGGNLPPLLAAARLLAGRGHEVAVLTSEETRAAAERAGLRVVGFRRSPAPDVGVAFELQAEQMMATAAGIEIALDTRDVIEELGPELIVADCMLPAALAAGEVVATPTASLVHFLYGVARQVMLRTGGSWTTDMRTLARTRRALGLAPLDSGLAGWERPDLALVTAPEWLDVDAGAPRHVVHAGPLGVDVPAAPERSRVLLTFSSTVMEGQHAMIERVCAAVGALDMRATLTLGPAVARDAVAVPDAIEVLDFADHDRLLPECTLVVSHAGLGTVLRALAHGVPLLMLPLGRDQTFNAGRVEALGAGIRLPHDASPRRIRAALGTLSADASFRAAAIEAERRIAAARPDQMAAEALEALGRPAQGSSQAAAGPVCARPADFRP